MTDHVGLEVWVKADPEEVEDIKEIIYRYLESFGYKEATVWEIDE